MAIKTRSRRPIEYLLYFVLVALVIFATWSIWTIRKSEANITSTKVDSGLSQQDNQDIGSIVENEADTEEANLEEVDKVYQEYSNELTNAANNVGGSFDETAY